MGSKYAFGIGEKGVLARRNDLMKRGETIQCGKGLFCTLLWASKKRLCYLRSRLGATIYLPTK